MQRLADTELDAYDSRRREADRIAEEMADMPDEDGFVKVIRRRKGRSVVLVTMVLDASNITLFFLSYLVRTEDRSRMVQ